MAAITPLVGGNKIKDEYSKINDNFTSLNTELTTHTGATDAHGATSAATANRIARRDGNGNFSIGNASSGAHALNLQTADGRYARTSGAKVVTSGSYAGFRGDADTGTNFEVDALIDGIRRGLLSVSDAWVELRKYASDGTTIETFIRLASALVTINRDLEISKSTPRITLNATSGNAPLTFAEGGANRWSILYDSNNDWISFFSNVQNTSMMQLHDDGTIRIKGAIVHPVGIYSGSGNPEGNVTAPPGSIYQNTSGGTGTTLYVKRSGTGNTGWFAVA